MLCDAVLMWAEMCSVVLVVRWGGSSRDICRWRVERLVPATHCHTVRPQLRERYSHYRPLLLHPSPVRANPSQYPVTPSPLQSVWRVSDQPSSPLQSRIINGASNTLNWAQCDYSEYVTLTRNKNRGKDYGAAAFYIVCRQLCSPGNERNAKDLMAKLCST